MKRPEAELNFTLLLGTKKKKRESERVVSN